MNITWLILWAVAGWLIGILTYFLLGFTAHIASILPRVNGHAWINKFANHYSKVAMKLLGRGVLVERGTKYDVYRASHDAEKNADTFSLDGETAHVTNDTGLLSTLHKRPFGLVPPPEDNIATYVSPELGEFGQIEAKRKENKELTDSTGTYIDMIETTATRPLVKLRDYARYMIPGSRSLYDLDETVDLYRQSQRMFGQTKTTQFMILIMAYAAGAGIVWLLITQGGGSGNPSVPVSPIGGIFL